jgi:hypothetical protein
VTFLAPALIALGLAAAVPLALHLFQRHHGPRVVFPALRYLRRAERERATRLRLRQVLLLALRVLAILLLAGAAARPFLLTGGRGHHPTAVVIILDNSLSSGAVVEGRRVLDQLRDAALVTLGEAGPDDRFWLIRAGEPWEPALAGGPELLAAALAELEPAATLSDLPAQLQRAASILAAEGGGRAAEVHVLADLRVASFLGGGPGGGGLRVLVLEPTGVPDWNRAVTAIDIGGGLPPLAGEAAAVTARIEGSVPGEDAAQVDARLVVEGQVAGAGRTELGVPASLLLPPREPGLVAGRVEIDPDALAADDRRYFVAEVRRPPAVRLTTPTPYLTEALDILEEAGRLRRWTAGSDQVVIAPGAVGAEAVRRGARVIVLPPPSPLELAAANQRLGAAGIPWRLSAPSPGEARLEGRGTGLDGVLADVRLREAYGLEPAGDPEHAVLIRLRSGEPWAVAGAAEGGRYLILGTPLTLEGGTLPASPAMLPLVDRAVNAWVAGGAEHREHHPGDMVALPAGDSVLRPDGGADPARAGGPYRLTLQGVYRVLAGDSTVAAYAVNPPAAASETGRLDGREVAGVLGGYDVRVTGPEQWDRAIYHRRLGRDVSAPLLIAAALVLLLEAALSATGRGARRDAGALATGAAAGTGRAGG